MDSRAASVFLFALLASACDQGAAAPAGRDPLGDSYQGGEASARAAGAVAVESGPRIVFLGDSIAAGHHLSPDQAFPAVLQGMLVEEGLPFRLVNAGVSGDTSAGGLGRIDWFLKQEPDWVVIELGGNDGLRGQPVETIASNLRAIIHRVQEAGIGVVLLGQVIFPNYGPDYTRDFRGLYDAIASDYELVYVPYFMEGVGGVPELNLSDGLHPTPEGHRLIAKKLLPTFRKLLQDS